MMSANSNREFGRIARPFADWQSSKPVKRALELGVRLPEHESHQPIPSEDNPVSAARDHLRRIRSLADLPRESMLGESPSDVVTDVDAFEDAADAPRGTLERFPAVGGEGSLAYSAEAIRAFLEREIGLEGKFVLQRDLIDTRADPFPLSSRALDPQMAILAQQLLIIDEQIQVSYNVRIDGQPIAPSHAPKPPQTADLLDRQRSP
jgi:hypothetical protein